jgi:alpha-L-fucosidase 2
MANIFARLSDGASAKRCLDLLLRFCTGQNLYTYHNDWRNMGMTMTWGGDATEQLDANFGAVNAIQEMVFCWQREALSILPALPARLSHGDVRGMVFPDGTLDMTWQADGTVDVTIRAVRDLDTAVLLCGRERERITLRAGESLTRTYVR